MQFSLFLSLLNSYRFFKINNHPPTFLVQQCDNHRGVQFSIHICVFLPFRFSDHNLHNSPHHHNFTSLIILCSYFPTFFEQLHCYSFALRLHLLKRDAHERKRFEAFLCDILSLFNSYFYFIIAILFLKNFAVQSEQQKNQK